MDRDVFIVLADEIQPYLQPGRSPRGLDVLSVEKQLALTLYLFSGKSNDLLWCGYRYFLELNVDHNLIEVYVNLAIATI